MTRYARAKGSKSSNSRQPCSATPWYSLKQRVSYEKRSEPVNIAVKSNEVSSGTVINRDADWYNFSDTCGNKRKKSALQKADSRSETARKRRDSPSYTAENLTEPSLQKNRSESKLLPDLCDRRTKDKVVGENKEVSVEGYCPTSDETDKVPFMKRGKKCSDKAEPCESKKKHANRKMSVKVQHFERKNLDDLRALRRSEKAMKREKKIVCYCCRRWGHQVVDCPEFSTDKKLNMIIPSGSFCYNCGSTEHKMAQCNKTGKKTVKFACCFVCGGEGHIARLCPDNTKGVYPMGGSCLLCGAVDHLQTNCPRADKDRDTECSLVQLSSGPIESIPEDSQKTLISLNSKRVIHF